MRVVVVPWRRLLPALVVGALALPVSPPAASAASSWVVDLSGVDRDDSDVVVERGTVRLAGHGRSDVGAPPQRRTGVLVLAPRRLATPVNRVAADLTGAVPPGAELAVDVRGRRRDGRWTEWVEARPGQPAALATPTTTVQARAVLSAAPGGAGPELRQLRLSGDTEPDAEAAPPEPEGDKPAAPASFRVYATREGLVGGKTANGHIIVDRDHFVALPSRRGLAPRDTGDYTVSACADNGRCEWAPVWDVGPWNTKDDHWNAEREMWQDLPRGLPQAQAAYEDGHNGGKDQFGRTVRNPAGIDLADGMFWDGLRLTANEWVTVTYVWTGTGPVGTVNGDDVITVHSKPQVTAETENGMATPRAQVPLECETTGEFADGTTKWFRVGQDRFVPRGRVDVTAEIPPC
ncbi:hypothetical protein [Streptoalloteichus hindustanus]|uniref:Ig-like domain-containing protein n=1 Tax=Streptoalloteichus hindustanus TaxID=2017 RepID=A0A1M4TTY7_STRHI|nr:hypothetical protein [Streptoalloteichus hindustanus]SHE47941.1 hypothetical protein SAMN05444320_101196 [Streptoalloteichus hindustanus]